MQLRRSTRYWIVMALVALPAAGAGAQGFGLNEISTCGIGRGFAATATGCHDASAIYWNPAATASLSRWTLTAGAAAIILDGKFEQDTTFRTYKGDVPTTIVPHAFVNYHNPASRASWGVGAYVPYGLTSQWKDEFPGRFLAKKASLQTIYIQPNAAWQVTSRISVGAGPIIGHSNVELIQGIDLSQQTVPGQPITFASLGVARRTEFARARLKGGAWGYGAHIGVQATLSTSWTLGARYLTPITFEYKNADATFSQRSTGLTLAAGNPLGAPAGTSVDALLTSLFTSGAPLSAQNVSTKITHPQQLQVGLAYTGFSGWELEADYALVVYSAFKELPINFSNSNTPDRTLLEQYENSHGIRLGIERRFAKDVHLRAGFAGVKRAAPDETVTPLLPEQDRANYTLGVTVPFGGHWKLDGGYLLVTTPGRRGRIDERTNSSQTAVQLNTGVYSLTANILALSLTSSF